MEYVSNNSDHHYDSPAAEMSSTPSRPKKPSSRHPEYHRRNLLCELREPSGQKRVRLGTYPTPEMVLWCRDFVDLASWLPVPVSKDAKELKGTVAEAFRPMGGGDDTNDSMGNGGNFLRTELCDEWSVAPMADEVLMSPPPCMEWRFSWDDEPKSDGTELELWSF